MNTKIRTWFDMITQVVFILAFVFLGMKLNLFCLGMMNPLHPVKFGLGVSLMVGLNILLLLGIIPYLRKILKTPN